MLSRTTKPEAGVIVVGAYNRRKLAMLSRRVNKLVEDAAKLYDSEVEQISQKAVNRVLSDVEQVKSLITEVSGNEESFSRSRMEHPVQFVREFLDKNPEMTRRDAISALRRKGVNAATARTQYQLWRKRHH